MRHLFIMPDGNRRWAKKRGKSTLFGHRHGAKKAELISQAAFKADIECVTVWGCSVKNIEERPAAEVKALFAVFDLFFKRFLSRSSYLKEHDVRVQSFGRWRELFPKNLVRTMERLEKETAHHTRHRLTFLMAYGGYDEMIAAIQKIALAKIPAKNISRDVVKHSLWTRDLPPVDLVIRTGGEPHWSDGAMMWDAGDAQLYFTDTLWPDFTVDELARVLARAEHTPRRLGR